ncbi:MAG: hypothetical protein ABH882_06965 [Candidatus Omnitrophota bacterium]
MSLYPSKRLIQEANALIRLSLFLKGDVGLKAEFSAKELKQLLYALKPKK